MRTMRLACALVLGAVVVTACSSGGGETPAPSAGGGSSAPSASSDPSASSAGGASASPGGGEVSGLPDDATVTYAFHDSSVPPQYHRSFTLTVTKDESRIVVDSYGDVLADETAPTPPQVWATLGSTLSQVSSLEQAEPQEACAGGTGADLVVESAGTRLVDLSPQFCGGSNAALEEPMLAWIRPARDLFPPTDVLAPEGE